MKLKVLGKTIAASLAIILTLSMVGCGTKKVETTPTQTTPTDTTTKETVVEKSGETDFSILKGKTISFLTSQGKFFDEYNTMADAIKADYGVTVEFQVVPDNEYYSMIKVKLSTSETSDVFEYNTPTQNGEIGAREYTVDLSDQPWVSRLINPALLKDSENGKIYALPKESSSGYQGAFYNKKVLADLGIVDPAPKTYEEFIEILETIKQKGNGVVPFYETNADTWTTQIFMTSGIPVSLGDKSDETFKALLANKLKWTDIPEAQDVLQKHSDLITNGYVNNDHLSVNFDTATEAIGTGKAAIYLSIEQFAANVASKYPETELGSMVIPFNGNQVMSTGAYVQGLFIPKSGKQVEESKAFLEVWSMKKYQDLYYTTKPGFPAFNDVDGGKAAASVQSLVDNYIATGKYTYQLNDQMAFVSPIWPDLWTYYVESASGTKTPKQVFETFQKQYVDYMQQQGVEGF